jgi:ubiquinone/menaquinone biosynthesis C-methylase UbiE
MQTEAAPVNQHSNSSWWSANPMTYDWEGTITAPEGSEEFFKQSDARALEAHRPFGHPNYPAEAPYSQLIDWKAVKGKRVLEIGCGMGLHASLFAKAGAKITTMDLTTRASRVANRRFRQNDLSASVVQADGEKLPFRTASFDQVWSWGVIHHSSNTPQIVEEIFRILKPGGLLQIMVYHRSSVRYWIIGGIQHGIVKGKLLKMNLEQVNQTFTDGAIARHYTQPEAHQLLGRFKNIRTRILQEAGSDALPKISPVLRRLAPSTGQRFDQWVNARWGWFLFAEATKP